MDNFQISTNFGPQQHLNFDTHNNWDDCNKSYQLVCNITNECSSVPYGSVSGGSGSELYNVLANQANGSNSPIMEFDPIASLFTCSSPNCNNRANDVKLDRVSLVSDCEETLTPQLSKYNYNNNHSIYSMHNTHSNSNYQSPLPSLTSPIICSNATNPYNNISHCSPQSLNSSAQYVIHPQIQMTSPSGQSNHNQNPNPNLNHNPNPAIHEHMHHNPNPNPNPNAHMPSASMSVNLSMNMTMGFSGGESGQMQWTPVQSVSAYQTPYQSQSCATPLPYHHMHSTSFPCPSPTFTINAEFRPTTDHISTTLPPIEKEFAGVCNIKPVQSSIYSHQKLDPYHYHFRHHFSHSCNKSNKCHRNNSSSAVIQNCEPIDKSLNSAVSASATTNLCRICGKTYARPSTLKTHLRTHSGERPYRCNTCNKSFSQAANLTAHIRTHSGEKPFRCPVCGRKFSQSSSVTTHMRTHSGERPYRCCMCKKAFSDSSTLTKHLRIHSGEKPYQCKLCLLRFSQSGNLNRHMRIHANII